MNGQTDSGSEESEKRYFSLKLRPMLVLALLAGASVVVAWVSQRASLDPWVGGLALGGAVFLAALGCLNDETPNRKVRAWLATTGHFLATNLGAAAYGWYRYLEYIGGDAQVAVAKGDAWRDYFLAAGAIGGLLALARSTRTNSSTLEMAARLDRMERGAKINEILVEKALAAHNAATQAAWTDAMRQMVIHANPNGGALSVWVCIDGTWRIVAQDGLSKETETGFTMDPLMEETPGAGIVANMDATQTSRFHEKHAQEHPWFKPDPAGDDTKPALAASLLQDARGERLGAVCLTYDPKGTYAPSSRDVDATLLVWEGVFTLALERLVADVQEGGGST